jgi:hypothetical protein
MGFDGPGIRDKKMKKRQGYGGNEENKRNVIVKPFFPLG